MIGTPDWSIVMPNQIQKNRAEAQRANDPDIRRDNERLGPDAERERRAQGNREQGAPAEEEEE